MHPRTTQIQALLKDLFELLPAKVIGVRTDYIVTPVGANRRVLICEYFAGRHHYCLISPRDGLRERGIKSLRCSVGIEDEARCNRVLALAEELAEINDLGAWPRQPETGQDRVIDGKSIAGHDLNRMPGPAAAYDALLWTLPAVQSIVIHAMHEQPNKKSGHKRKAWLSFMDKDGNELVALLANPLPAMLRDFHLQLDEDAYRLADRHLGRWAHQLGIEQAAMTEALTVLTTLDLVIRPTFIDLRKLS